MILSGKYKKKQVRTPPKDTIGVAGLGCIGGSIAKALTSSGYNVSGCDRDMATLEQAFYSDAIAMGHKDIEILRGCKVIFVCTPLESTGAVITQLYNVVGDSAIITDVASVKQAIRQGLPKGIRFVGGHPMAGSENGGFDASKSHMFQNAYYILTGDLDNADAQKVLELVQEMGAIPIGMTDSQHDSAVAKISHLPHMIAYSLVNNSLKSSVGAENIKSNKTDTNTDIPSIIAAGGFRDITRVASSAPDLWVSVAKLNKTELLKEMESFIAEFVALKESIEQDDLAQARTKFTHAKDLRDGIEVWKGSGHYVLKVDIQDTPGIIGKIATLLGKKGINMRNIRIDNSREGAGGVLSIEFGFGKDYTAAQEILAAKKFKVH